jgi:hypothetical protein
MHQYGAVGSDLFETPERAACFIYLCEVTNENANTQIFVLCSLKSQSILPCESHIIEKTQEGTKWTVPGDLTGWRNRYVLFLKQEKYYFCRSAKKWWRNVSIFSFTTLFIISRKTTTGN